MENIHKINKNIYITNSEEIKEGDWCLYSTKEDTNNEQSIPIICKITRILDSQDGLLYEGSTGLVTQYPIKLSKIILTTDQDLDGVQAIDDEFLEWFVKNPSCEFVEVGKLYKNGYGNWYRNDSHFISSETKYKIIIPQEESKQETLEEAAEIYVKAQLKNKTSNGVIKEAMWWVELIAAFTLYLIGDYISKL